jgi:pimeloyl-ACP methyl ester carboxylesterase
LTRKLAGWLCLPFVLAACSDGQDARVNAAGIAASAGLRRMDIRTGTFDLVAYVRFAAAPVLRVYIEGDGHAWMRRDTPSEDPTPWNPVALDLAAVDPAPSVAYLARPCQYIAAGTDPGCRVYYWTEGRYAEPVIASMNAAIDRLLAASGAESLELIGFSGGGSVAALVAARRQDVANLRTVAANLDTAAWTAEQRLSRLTGSLNPADFTDKLAYLPQMHFSAADDSVVGIAVVRAFQGRFARRNCVGAETVPGVGHGDGWQAVWPSLLRRPVRCAGR